MAGTFTIHNTLIHSFIGSWHNVSGSLYSTPDTGPLGSGPFGISIFAGETINIDGVDHSINDLPIGFRVLTANWTFILLDGHGSIHGGSDGVPTCTGETASDGSITVSHGGAGDVVLGGNYSNKTIFELLTDELVVTFSLVAGTYIVQANLGDNIGSSNFLISGTYDIVKTQFKLETKSPVYVGDKVKVSSDTPVRVDELHIDYDDPIAGHKTIIIDSDSYYIIVWGLFEFWFYLPIELGTFSGNIFITFFGSGTQFSGSEILGVLKLLYEDSSGIYRLQPSQVDDILYFRQGNVTDEKFVLLQNIVDDEIDENDNFFNLFTNSIRLLSQIDDNDSDNGDQLIDFPMITTPRVAIVLVNVEIPSPFAKTAFLP